MNLSRNWAALALTLSLTACGGGGGSPNPPPAETPAPAPAITFLAGDLGGPGDLDGAREAARFNNPAGIALDAATGTTYVVDTGNFSIRRIDAGGEVSLLAGIATPADVNHQHPQRDGDRSVASFNFPVDAAFDASRGLLYVTDAGSLRQVTRDGTVATVLRNQFPGGATLGISTVAAGADGTLFLTAGGGGRAIYRVAPGGTPVLLAGDPGASGSVDGTGAAARFRLADNIAADEAGNVYVADAAVVRKVTPAGVVTTLAGSVVQSGFVDGAGAQARFGGLLGLAATRDGNVLIADVDNRAIRQVTPLGTVSTLYGDVPFVRGTFARITIDAQGLIFYTAPHGVFSARPGNAVGLVAGTLQPARGGAFDPAAAIAVDSQGNIFSASPEGVITKFGPDGTPLPFGADVGGVRPAVPAGSFYRNVLAIDAADNLYQTWVTLEFPSRQVGGSIVRIAPSGAVTIVATSNLQSAVPFQPYGLTPDAAGNLYFVDEFGPAIRRLASDGTLTLVANVGPTPLAGVVSFGLAVDSAGRVYMSSTQHCVIYRIDGGHPVGFAGQLDRCGDVDGAAGVALLQFAKPPVVDLGGNLLVAQANTLRRIRPDGSIVTIAGQPGLAGTRLGPLPGSLASLFLSGGPWIAADGSIRVVAGSALLKISPAP